MGLRWYFRCGCLILKPRPALDFSSKKSGVDFLFFWKIQNELIWPKMVFLVIFWKIWWFFDNSDTLSSEFAFYDRRTSFAYEFKGLFKKLFVRTSYWLYLVFRSRSIEVNFWAETQQLGFLKNEFVARLRHLRSIWDLCIRAFDKAHPTVRAPSTIIIIWEVIVQKHPQKNRAWHPALLDAPRWELFIRIFKSVVHTAG